MEELSRIHKPVPFGWFDLLQRYLASRAAKRSARAPWGLCVAAGDIPGDLHHLSGPH